MIPRVERLASKLTSIVSAWPCVECVVLCEASDMDLLDPYFALVMDVYCSSLPPASRHIFFDDPGAFETSWSGKKDRFFLDSIPIRIEYKDIHTIEVLVEQTMQATWIPGTLGTYGMYRLANGMVLYGKTDWLKKVRADLLAVPDAFWNRLLEAYQRKMEHCLSDLGGAALKDDRPFYFVSLADFVRASVSAVFAANKRWEPSGRTVTEELFSLPNLPEHFISRWTALMNVDGTVDPAKRFQIAQLIARSIVPSV